MKRKFLYAKVHRMIVTQADLEYEGSLTLDVALMEAAGMLPYQAIDVYNVTQGTRFSTYLIEGARGGGDCCVNGAAAHLADPGDRIIIAAYADLEDDEVASHRPRLVFIGDENTDFEVREGESAFRRVV